jgi:hypothetical protein
LNVAGTFFSGFDQKKGTKPQRMRTRSRFPSAPTRITSIVVVGAML